MAADQYRIGTVVPEFVDQMFDLGSRVSCFTPEAMIEVSVGEVTHRIAGSGNIFRNQRQPIRKSSSEYSAGSFESVEQFDWWLLAERAFQNDLIRSLGFSLR